MYLCRVMGLFCRCTGLFCEYIGLFRGHVGPDYLRIDRQLCTVIHTRDTTHPRVMYDLSIYVIRLIHVCAMAHL